MEPDYVEASSHTTSNPSTYKPAWTWYRNQTYEFYRYVKDENTGMMQKVYDNPHQQHNTKNVGANIKKGILNHSEPIIHTTSRKSTPISFEPLERSPKFFMEGGTQPIIEAGTYGPTKLQTTNFNSKDSEGITAWHYSQSPFDLDSPLDDTPIPSKIGTIYIHRNIRDGGYQVWIWLLRGNQEVWRPVDLGGSLIHHPEIASRVLTMQASTGNPSWVLHSTLLTTQGRQLRKRRSQSRARSPFARSDAQ
ncbi:hypothetical protein EV368DRAFT_81794 [Lentinula lateritia]|nr:hypothetical protein EV368DRAFT_81794 [Lentinula lateritia]